jgi:hypothetical protein
VIPYDELQEPFDLAIDPPDGFVEVEGEERDFLLADEHKTWIFGLDGGHQDTRLIVSAYLLPDEGSVADYDSQVALILDYDRQTGNTVEESNIYPALVHGYTGVHRYFRSDTSDDGRLFQRHFFMFAGQHVIQLTCQWRQDFDATLEACRTINEAFTYPPGWPIAEAV